MMAQISPSVCASGPVLALIPARGGSKSVPRKNLRLLRGKPLIAYTIQHALACSVIDRTIVSTDNEEIAEIARAHGAEVPFLRPAEISGDYALDVEFHRHALEWLEEHESYQPAFVVNLRPTHPMRNPATLERAIRTFAAVPDADCLRSVRPSELSPYKMWRIAEDGYGVPVAPLEGVAEPYNMPRQLLPMSYWQDGYVDITRPEVIFSKNSTTGSRLLLFVIDEQVVDIDYEEDWAIAERMLGGGPAEESAAAFASGPRHPS